MKILFAARGIFPDSLGGSSRHSCFLIKHLAEFNCQIDVIHPSPNQHFTEYDNVREIHIPYGTTIFSYSKNIVEFLKDKTYDIGYSDGLSLIKYLKNRRFACLFNHHGYHIFQRQDFSKILRESPKEGLRDFIFWVPRRKACKYAASHSDYVISLGGDLTHLIQKAFHLKDDKLLVLPNGMNLATAKNAREPIKRIPNSFLFVGGLVFRKGLTFLIRALNEIEHDFSFYIVGKGPLENWIQRNNKNKNVKILGRVSDEKLFDLYSQVDCFFFPSLQEGMPTVVLEAMANCLPVIATDVGAMRTMVKSENGFIIESRSVEVIKRAIVDFRGLSSEKKREMGRESRRIVEENFTWPKIAKDYYKIFQEIAGKQ